MALIPQNLTEYNTATNRRISMLGIADDTTYKSVSAIPQDIHLPTDRFFAF